MQSLGQIKKSVRKKFKTKEYMDRYHHITGVVKMAKHLAKLYGVDKRKAEIAALLHDFCKYDSLEQQRGLITEQDITECEKYPVLYHSYASAEYYRKYVGNDEDIYLAIRNHVFGRLSMSHLEEIILISDYTEKNRKYANCVACREILLSGKFYKAIYESTKFTIAFIEKKGLGPHPLQLEVLKYYEGLCEL